MNEFGEVLTPYIAAGKFLKGEGAVEAAGTRNFPSVCLRVKSAIGCLTGYVLHALLKCYHRSFSSFYSLLFYFYVPL